VVPSNHGAGDHQAAGRLSAEEEDVLPPIGGDVVQTAVPGSLRSAGWHQNGRGVSH